ncbi:DUF4136 domain-containing protein [Tenacibaculum piscium]|uniref:DUF4136 domain-containing protein n=1 Tax=Tenacibaculum piscium TaxID=1458515 RepID=UPI001F3873D9|nr:DUF4136 domain-containing protein [Tenacibaculum piscium]
MIKYVQNSSILLILVFSIIGCSSSKVVYDYDTSINFENYKTFQFFEDAGKGLNALDIKRVTGEIIFLLEQKGMKLSDNPDMYIDVLSKESIVENNSTIGVGIGGGGRVGFNISGGIPLENRKIKQELTVNFIAGKNDALLWQGIANTNIKKKLNPQERTAYYQKITAKILEKYPPEK